jgi:uncharacterized membrane protein HdeD (DUF308 family)
MRVLPVVVGILIAVLGLPVLFGMDVSGMNSDVAAVIGWLLALGGITLAVMPFVSTPGARSAS